MNTNELITQHPNWKRILYICILLLLAAIMCFLNIKRTQIKHTVLEILWKEPKQSIVRECQISVNAIGRLGNLMGQYATLFALSKLNNRAACIIPAMAKVLHLHFKQLSLPTLNNSEIWKNKSDYNLHDWMDIEYIHLPPSPFLFLTGYPYSWTFYHHIKEEIVQEFQFKDEILTSINKVFASIDYARKNLTFIGVHVRRSDYVRLMRKHYRGVVAHSGFFQQAMDYFNEKYEETAYLVVSDDLEWCRLNINNSLGNVHFVGNGDLSSPAYDLALMAHCNHSIIDIGSFGFWGAYLAGGETIYLTNYTLPDSPFLKAMKYNASYLPEWIPIAANLTPIAVHLNITGI